MKRIKAIYHQPILPEHRNNPLIESLPPKLSDELLIDQLSNYPSCAYNETQLDAIERIEYVSRLKDLRQPLPVYLEVFRAVESAIKEGYSAKNPLLPTTMNYLHYSLDERSNVEPSTGYFKPKGCGITVIGESGVGKTCMLEQVLGYFPDAIEHTYYKDKHLPIRQIIWLKVDCPDDSSVKGLCHRILEEIDRKLGLPSVKPASTIALLISQIEARMKSSFLGILVIDEMQNLNLAKAGGADRLLGFLHNLVNNLGIPLLFCANPPFDLMEYDDEWSLFIEELWLLQWTNINTPLTEELNYKLYDLSVGNMDLAVRIFQATQKFLIGSLDERLTMTALEYGASIAVRVSKPVTDRIRKERNLTLLRQKKTSSIKQNIEEVTTNNVQFKPELVMAKGKLISIPGDLTRAHHQEFAEKLIYLQNSETLHDAICDLNLCQRAATENNPLDILRNTGILCEDPLEIFK